LWRLGTRVVRSGVFPPPGTAVIHDTVVLRGSSARHRGQLLRWFGMLVGAAAGVLAFALWRLISLLQPSG
jgi:hypothetical protein